VNRAQRSAVPATIVAIVALLVACSAPGAATPPPSGACVVADASNTVALSAKNIKFSALCIEAAAGTPIIIKFTNEESVPHNVTVYTDNSKQSVIVQGDTITGPGKTTTITVPAQQPGQLYFACTIHPQMNGALVVTAAPAPSAS
jgi:plastocyanin